VTPVERHRWPAITQAGVDAVLMLVMRPGKSITVDLHGKPL
jgi:hypothetical protein